MSLKLINNISERVVDDLKVRMSNGSRVSIAVASFSIYAFEALKKELEKVEQLRFIFTSPTFVSECGSKEKREFFIPKLNRERNLYGTDFEIRLRNKLSQKAIAKEFADWIRRKVQFKSNSSSEQMGGFLHLSGESDAVKHIYFVAETKGSMSSLDLRGIESGKIACAEKLFKQLSTSDVHYGKIDSFDQLMTLVR